MLKHSGTKMIETPRLQLRPFSVEDAEAMYRNWASDEEVTKFMTWPAHKDVAYTRKLLTEWVAGYERNDKYEWCIVNKETREPIGGICAVNINEKVASADIGYCIGRSYWHKGYASEALKAIIVYLMDEVGMRRLGARHDIRNPRSGQVMQKCGMKYEGTRVQADWNNSGIHDTVLYGIVKDRTEPLKPSEHDCPKLQAQSRLAEAKTQSPKHMISDETIESVGILAKLSLTPVEKEQAKKDMGRMLDYIDKLNELDTEGVTPLSHVFPIHNVFREDVIENGDDRERILQNAPAKKDGSFKVPRTVE